MLIENSGAKLFCATAISFVFKPMLSCSAFPFAINGKNRKHIIIFKYFIVYYIGKEGIECLCIGHIDTTCWVYRYNVLDIYAQHTVYIYPTTLLLAPIEVLVYQPVDNIVYFFNASFNTARISEEEGRGASI